MRKWNALAVALVVILVIAGALAKLGSHKKSFEKTEYMFDTVCSITAFGDNAREAVEAAFDRLAEIHSKADFFSESSEISKINDLAGDEEFRVSSDLGEVIEISMKVRDASNGAFDIALAPVVSLWNFSGEGDVPPAYVVEETLAFVKENGFFYADGKITKASQGVKLDLGGAVKGYAAVEAAKVLEEFGVKQGVIDLGGNICCIGENPKTKNGKWRIGIQKPFSPTGEYDEVVEISDGVAVTSGSYQRYFEKDGKVYHHIIDPETGYPADRNYDSVTVIMERSPYADCLATACFVLGEVKGRELAKEFGAEVIYK